MKEINEGQKKRAKTLCGHLAADFNEQEAMEFASRNQEKQWFDHFKLLLNMIRDPEFNTSTKTKLLIAGTLAYVILPLDVIPDFLPIVGWLDDIFILGLANDSLRDDIEAYKIKEDKSV